MKIDPLTRKQFEDDGFLVLDEIITKDDALVIIDAAEKLSAQLANAYSSSALSSQCGAYLSLANHNRTLASSVFDSLVKIPEVQSICYSNKLHEIAKQLLQSSLVLAPPTQMNLRSDFPEEKKHLYPWHRDYDYNFSSSNSLVFWIPLQDVDETNGSLHYIPGSHMDNVPISINDQALALGQSSQYFTIDRSALSRISTPRQRCNIKLGQCMVFHSKLIHKSGSNNSTHIRYALQSRWFDATATDAILNKYRGGVDEGNDPRSYL